MADYIDREKYCAEIFRCNFSFCDKPCCQIWKAPAADVAEVGRGCWLEPENEWEACVISCICSVCGWRSHLFEDDVKGMPYCPNCGAKMDGGNT